jgi:hypothetical protein
MIVSLGIFVGVVVTDIITTISGKGFRFDQNGVAITGMNVFVYGYMAFVCVVIFLMFVLKCFQNLWGISHLIFRFPAQLLQTFLLSVHIFKILKML